jgi:hypothetical protein
MTEVELYQPRAAAVRERDIVDGWVGVVKDVARLADHIAETDFVPKALRNRPAAIAACILTGREMGIGPMTSLKVIHMVQGTPSLSAEFKRARALELGHEIVYDETTTTRCVVRGRRVGEDNWLTVTWHIDDAKRAGLLGKDVWKQYPRRMLEARATSELCDLKFPDCSWGLATTEELQDGGVAELDAPEVRPAIEAAAPPPRTARRRQAADKPAEPVPTAAAPAAASAPTAGPATAQSAPSGLPPLPGEDEPDPTGSRGESSSAGQSRPRQKTSASSASSQPDSEPPPPLDFDPDEHGTSTRGKGGQLTALWTVLSEVYGFTGNNKAAARKAVEHIIGRDLDGETTGDLSYNEARTVLDTLARWQTIAEKRGEQPMDVLVAVMAGGSADG